MKLAYVIDFNSGRLLEFEDAKERLCVPPNYGFIWQKLQSITLVQRSLPMQQVDGELWMDWCLKSPLIFYTTILIFHFLGSSQRHKRWQLLQRSRHSKLADHSKVLIWWLIIGELPLGSLLRRRGLISGISCLRFPVYTCFLLLPSYDLILNLSQYARECMLLGLKITKSIRRQSCQYEIQLLLGYETIGIGNGSVWAQTEPFNRFKAA